MLTPRLRKVQWLSPAGLFNMAYKEWGEPDNPHALICVHGLTRVGQDFNDLAQALGHEVRVVAPDVPGRGGSDWLPDPSLYAIPVYVAACVALLARVNATTVDWLGTSMGGLIGMGLAGLSNSPVRKLIINDVGPTLNFEALQRIGAYTGQAISFGTLQQACEYIKTISAPFGPHTDAQWMAMTQSVMVEKDGVLKPHYDPGIGQAFKNITPEMAQMGEAALWASYDAITADTLLIRGEHSDLLTPETAVAMTQRGPKAKRIDIAGVGHAPTFMNAQQIEIVREFLLG